MKNINVEQKIEISFDPKSLSVPVHVGNSGVALARLIRLRKQRLLPPPGGFPTLKRAQMDVTFANNKNKTTVIKSKETK